MTPSHDRDAVVDRLLAAAPRPAGEPTKDCLDADTLAALADGGLSAVERAACMGHLAACAHCQAVLAAVIQTTPEPAPSRAWWQLRPWPWLVPALGGTMALLVWTAVDRRPAVTVVSAPPPVAEPKPMSSVEDREAKSSLDPLARKELERQMAAPLPLTERVVRPSSPRQQAEGQAKARAAAADAVVPAEIPARADAAPAIAPPAAGLAANAGALPAAPPPSAGAGNTASSSQPFGAGRALNPMLGGAAPPPAPSPPVAPPAESVVIAAAPGAADALRRVSGAPAPIEVRSSDPRVRWRMIGSAVEHSTDGGATWTPQAIGASGRLTAGSAPLPEVCWIVGDAGTVVVTADGLSWTRLAFPLQVPLASVSATSADVASVTTGDGRVFTTTDRGRTWK
ncbi:MAG: YCF48-related protein [Vicinamibacterales bacterium]